MVPGRVSWLLGWLVVLPRGPGLEGLGSFRISVCPVGAPLGPAAARGDPVGARAAEVKVLRDPAVSACKYHLQVVAAGSHRGVWGHVGGACGGRFDSSRVQIAGRPGSSPSMVQRRGFAASGIPGLEAGMP